MSLNMSELEFIDKYGFSLHDLYYACIDDIMRKSYWCCSIGELANDIAEKIHNTLDSNNPENSEILYKSNKEVVWKTKIFSYDIAIRHKDIFICFEIGWLGNSLSVKDWDMKPENEILKDDNYFDISELENEDELEE